MHGRYWKEIDVNTSYVNNTGVNNNLGLPQSI